MFKFQENPSNIRHRKSYSVLGKEGRFIDTANDRLWPNLCIDIHEHAKVLQCTASGRGALLDFDGIESLSVLDQKIDLLALFVAIEIQCWFSSCIVPALDDFTDNEGLEKGSGHISSLQRLGSAPLGKPTGQPCVKKVELGRLRHLFFDTP